MDSGPTIGESPHPVFVHERIDLIDVVRGFALFGVLLSNLVWITTDMVSDRCATLAVTHGTAGPDCQTTRGVFRRPQVLHTLFLSVRVGVCHSAVPRRGASLQRGGRLRAARVDPRCHRARAYRPRLVWRHSARLCDRWVRAPGRSTLEHTTSASHWPWHSRSSHARLSMCRRAVRAHLTARGRRGDNANAEKERMLAIFEGTSYRAIARENAALFYGDIVVRGVGLFLLPQVFARLHFWTVRWPTQLGSTHDRTPTDSAPAPALGNWCRRRRQWHGHAHRPAAGQECARPRFLLGARRCACRRGRRSCPGVRLPGRARAVVSP